LIVVCAFDRRLARRASFNDVHHESRNGLVLSDDDNTVVDGTIIGDDTQTRGRARDIAKPLGPSARGTRTRVAQNVDDCVGQIRVHRLGQTLSQTRATTTPATAAARPFLVASLLTTRARKLFDGLVSLQGFWLGMIARIVALKFDDAD
jgi:hypothetical protein